MKKHTNSRRWDLFRLFGSSCKPVRGKRARRDFVPALERLEARLAPANVDVLSFHNDLLLSGQNLQEEVLTPANVNATGFGKLFSQPVDGYLYAQPLYKANLAIAGGTHNVAFLATEHDSVYAFDVDSPTAGPTGNGLYWKTSFLDPANGVTSVPAGDVGIVSTNIVPEVGITGTPVIDGSTNTLYVVAKTKEVRADGAHYVQKLHALDLTTGQEKFGGPATIGDTTGTNTNTSPVSVPGGGDGAVGGVVTFNARKELQRPALQLVNGVVYIAWASHEDDRPYHGWVVGYNAGNLAAGPVKVFNTAPNAGGVGIWESGGALGVDPQGNLYFAVGNGFNGPNPAFDPAHGNYSESVLKLSATGQLTVADYFTPFDWQTLDSQDADLGSGGTMLLPDFVGSTTHPHLIVETGKSGKIYLIDRDNMGHLNNPGVGPDLVVQTVTAGQAGVWGNPSFLKVNATTGIIYYHGQGDFLKGYVISNGHIDDTPGHILISTIRAGYPGTQPVTSANGIADPVSPTNAIVWELQVDAGDPSANPTGAVILRAFRGGDLSTELYDSNQTSLRDQPSAAVKFTAPVVTNGHVLVGAQYSFSVFGLFPAATAAPAARTNLQGAAQPSSQGAQIQLTWANPTPSTGAAPTGIRILRSTDGTTFTAIATVGRDATTYTDRGPLVSGQHYFYRVVATNQVGDSAPSNTADVIAPIPSAVLTIASFTSSSLGLSWTAVANGHYDVERSTDGVTFMRVATVPAPQTTYTDAGLAAGIYAYRIHAFNASPASDSLSNVRGATVGGTINHGSGFGITADLTANGNAQFVNNVVRLTGADLQTGSFFANTPLPIARFTTTFVLRASEGTQPNYADGFTFVLQANAPTALGQGLGGLGYQGIGNSVAIKFGTFQYSGDPSNSTTGLFLNGVAPRGGVSTLPNVLLNSQDFKEVTLTYDGTTLSETIRDVQLGTTFTTSFTVNIAQALGSDTAYAGFTASTGSPGAGSFWQLQDVGSWTFTSQAPLPGAPTNLRVTATAASEIDLAWDGHSFNETGFRVERSADSGATFTLAGTTTDTTFADTGLSHGTYYYRVRAFNANGASGFANVAVATVPASDPPPAITGVTRSSFEVKPNGTFTLTVTFTDPDANDPHTAVLAWGDGSANTTVPLAAGTLRFSASHQYASAPTGTNYSVTVTVQDDDGGSDTVALTASAASVTPPAGLVDWYTGDGLNPTTAADVAGGNPGTLVGGVTYLPGKVGNAFSFNGTDGYVKLPDNFVPFPTTGTRNVPFAFTAWFQTTTGGVLLGQQGGAPFGVPSGWVPAVYVGTDGKLRAQMFWNGGVGPAVSAAPVNDGQFHFVAVSSDGVTETAYLDGQPIGTISGAWVAYTGSYSYQLGTGYTAGQWQAVNGAWYSFKGLIDEVQVYNAALAPAAVGAIYTAGAAGQVKGVTVRETPPVITGVSRSAAAVNENGTLTLNVTFTDAQPGNTHTAVLTWGDGSPDTTLAVAAGATTFSASHRYLEEAAGGYAIRVTVQDIAGGSDTVNLTTGALAVAPPAGLVSWWTGDGTNPTTAPDLAGANPGALAGGVTYAAGKVGNAFTFDGGNGSYVNVPDAASLNVTTGATWDFWVKTSQSGSYVGLMGKHDAGGSLNGVTVWVDPSGVAAVQIKGASLILTLTGSTRVNDGQFHHLALTFQSGGPALLYVDGQQQASGTAPVFSFNPNPLRLGRMLDPFWAPLNGQLDEVQVFNRVLTAAEIQGIVNAGSAGQLKGVRVLDPAVVPTGGFTLTAVAGVASALQTVATFTDPGGPEALGDYSATISWGDNTSWSGGVISLNAGTGVFTVQGRHLYAQPGTFSLLVTIHHDTATDVTATGTAQAAPLVLHLLVAGFPSPTVAGAPGNFTVTVQDQLGETVTSGYTGTVHFTSSDPQATLPADYTFTGGDFGQHTFSATLKTAGAQSITATDTAMMSVTGAQSGIVVNAAALSGLRVGGFPTPARAGSPNTFTVTATDAYGNPIRGYTGTVHFSSSDGQAELPDDYTFLAADNGTHVFGGVLKTAGTQSIAAADTALPGISGTQSGIVVTPGAANSLVVSGFPSPVTAGQANGLTVTAKDRYGNTATGYRGTVHFTSSDAQAALPADSTLTNGTGSFSAALKTAGTQSLTATDTAAVGITGTQAGVVVNPAPAAALLVSDYPSPTTAGAAHALTVTAQDAYGNTATGYRGTVRFSSSDPQAQLEGDYTFTAADHGSHPFVAALRTAGTQSIAATDTAAGFSGVQAGIVVTGAAPARLTLAGLPAEAHSGAPLPFTVAALDAYGNVSPTYAATVSFSSTDPNAVLPGGYTFTAADGGMHAFTVTFETSGGRSLTVTDGDGLSATGVVAVSPAGFVVSGFPPSITAGQSSTFTVRAVDAHGNTDVGYTGTVHLSSSDPQAVLSHDYTFSAPDNGVHLFGAVLKTAGTQSITATDSADMTITGTQSGIAVNPSEVLGSFQVSGFPNGVAGTLGTFTVAALDPYGNVIPDYAGVVHFSSSDPQATAGSGLPDDYTFSAADMGLHSFSATLFTAGSQSITVTDTASGAFGTQSDILISPAAAVALSLSTPATTVSAGGLFPVTVTAVDAYGNRGALYQGTVHFSSSDGAANLPADYTFAASDHGSQTFAVGLNTGGSQTVTVADTSDGTLTDTLTFFVL
jgi:hypothetical protein